ncbi:MAG: hypothetical protein ACW967_08265 [Candidatus Hodarchaeales archaeon]|jgi:hypothetical protein
MDSYKFLPDSPISASGLMSEKFLELDIKSFTKACVYVHKTQYGYNSNYDDKLIFFKEKKGTCTTKHAVIGGLAEELKIPLYKSVGIYKLTEEISEGVNELLEKYKVPYVPLVHCFLVFKQYRFDLTEGNNNGKKTSVNEFIHTEKVDPFITRKDEYILYKRILIEKILTSKEMTGVNARTILKAREECINLLKKNMK